MVPMVTKMMAAMSEHAVTMLVKIPTLVMSEPHQLMIMPSSIPSRHYHWIQLVAIEHSGSGPDAEVHSTQHRIDWRDRIVG